MAAHGWTPAVIGQLTPIQFQAAREAAMIKISLLNGNGIPEKLREQELFEDAQANTEAFGSLVHRMAADRGTDTLDLEDVVRHMPKES